MHALTLTRTHTLTDAHTHTHTHTHTETCTNIHTRTDTHTYTHTHTRTKIHTHTVWDVMRQAASERMEQGALPSWFNPDWLAQEEAPVNALMRELGDGG